MTAVIEDYSGSAGFTLVASLLVNVTMVTFFFETNAPRNVSFPLALAVFLVGGVLAMLAAAPFAGFGGASVAGALVGEAAKIAVLAVALPRLGRGDWALTGMLVGAAVGAGYSVFSGVGVEAGSAGALEGYVAVYSVDEAARRVTLMRLFHMSADWRARLLGSGAEG